MAHDGFRCGYRTPGQIMSGASVIMGGRATTPDAVREWMSGNLCRCAADRGIVDAVMEAAGRSAVPQHVRVACAAYRTGFAKSGDRA